MFTVLFSFCPCFEARGSKIKVDYVDEQKPSVNKELGFSFH